MAKIKFGNIRVETMKYLNKFPAGDYYGQTLDTQEYVVAMTDGETTTRQQLLTVCYRHPSGISIWESLADAGMLCEKFGGAIYMETFPAEGEELYDHTNGHGMVYANGEVTFYDTFDEASAAAESLFPETEEIAPLPTNKQSSSLMKLVQYYQQWQDEHPRLEINDADFEEPKKIEYTHDALYHKQEEALLELEEQGPGFHMLAGEVGVGKTHIASEYIKDFRQENSDAKVVIYEPIAGVMNKFADLLDLKEDDKGRFVSDDGNIVVSNDPMVVDQTKHIDLLVMDEFHKIDRIKRLVTYPTKAASKGNLPTSTLALTGTVSNEDPEQIWRVGHNYAESYIDANPGDLTTSMVAEDRMMKLQRYPEAFLSVVLKDNSVSLLRNDIEELRVEERMPVNKKAIGFDLTHEDRAFYNFMHKRAKNLGIGPRNQLQVLDRAFNTGQKDFVVRPVKTLRGKMYYQMVDDIDAEDADDLLYLGKHEQPFVDRKIEAIVDLAGEYSDKILVYMTNDDYSKRVVDDLNKSGVTAEFVDTQESGAVDDINNSNAHVVVFDVRPIQEGIDLRANTVIWYNTPDAAGFDEQANGRITRLSSEKTEKNIYYLYHKTTIQEKITQNLIRTNEINNMALNRETENIEVESDNQNELTL